MNSLQVFTYQNSTVRTVEKGGEPWFVLKDVCGVLGIAKYRDVVERLDGDEREPVRVDTPGGAQEMIAVNESGLYNVILRSDKPEARPFRKWVTSEVLPAIRRTGRYNASGDTTKAALAEAKLNNSRARVSSMWMKIAAQVDTPEYKGICAHYASAALAGREVLPLPATTEKTYTAREVGERLGISANRVGRMANAHGLKTPEYGIEVWDKSPNSPKQVAAWRYNERAIRRFEELLAQERL